MLKQDKVGRNIHLVFPIIPSDSEHLIEINIHIIISFYHKLCLLTEIRNPEKTKYVFIGEVTVGIMEVALDDVIEFFSFFFNLLLILFNVSLYSELLPFLVPHDDLFYQEEIQS